MNRPTLLLALLAVITFIFLGTLAFPQQPVNVAKVSAPPTGQQTAANSDSVVCSSDMGCGAVTITSGTVTVSGGNNDPCENVSNTRTAYNVNFASTTSQVVVAATSAKKTYICNMVVDTQNSSGETFIITDGTQSTNPCDSGTPTALWGSTTASQGVFINPGVSIGNGAHTMMQTSGTNRQVCIATVSSSRATASGYYVQQ